MLLFILSVSCDKSAKNKINDYHYSINVVEKNLTNFSSYNYISEPRIINHYFFKHKKCQKDFEFIDSYLEIESYDEIKFKMLRYSKFKKYKIIIQKHNNSLKCFYLIWDSLEDDHIVPSQNFDYAWGINKNTEIVYSNLPWATVKSLYYDFDGIVINPGIDSIILDYNYSIESREFYENIQFCGFQKNKVK